LKEAITVIDTEHDELQLDLAKDFIKHVNEDLAQIKQPHFDIAFRLYEAKEKGYPPLLGYSDIYALSEEEFGLKKTSTATYISVCFEFMFGLPYYSKQWEAFSFSQLVEMLPINSYERWNIKPEMTVKQIRKWRQDNKVVDLPDGGFKRMKDLTPAERQQVEKAKETKSGKDTQIQTSEQNDDAVLAVVPDVDREIVVEPIGEPSALEPPRFYNSKEACLEWLATYESWGLWVWVPMLNLKTYKCEFTNGTIIVASVTYEYHYNSGEMVVEPVTKYHLIDKEHTLFDFAGTPKSLVIEFLMKHNIEVRNVSTSES
jgi:hypothetical protein